VELLGGAVQPGSEFGAKKKKLGMAFEVIIKTISSKEEEGFSGMAEERPAWGRSDRSLLRVKQAAQGMSLS